MLSIAELPRYGAYKDAGIGWLGKIPSDWNIRRLKYLLHEVNERSESGEEKLLSVSQYTGVTPKSERMAVGDLMTNAESLEGYKIVRKNDLVSNIMLAWNGSLGFSAYDGIVSPAYSVYRLQGENIHGYFHYLLRTEIYKAEYKRKSTGVIDSRLRLYSDDFFDVWGLIPTPKEQLLIANYLDKKTTRIDEAIAIKEQQIALLKERKQIIIQKAVTQGLDPNVPMKDSGVDWIGEIPAHWEVKRLKYVTKIVKRIAGYEGPDVLSITQKGIKVKDIDSGEGQLAMDYSKYQIVEAGDFAMNHMDLLTGYVDISKYNGVVSPDYRVFIRTYAGLDDEFLLAIFQLGYQQKIFYRYGQGVSLLGRWRFPADNFNNFFVPIPPKEEQKLIFQRVNEEWHKIDKGIELLLSQIEKLRRV